MNGYDKWRMLLCENHHGYKAVIRESDQWDGTYEKIAGPVKVNSTGTRIWPNVIPLPEGYPARYIALMMDRLNFPGMKGANWTYGAMYLYHAHPVSGDRLDYEYKSSQTDN